MKRFTKKRLLRKLLVLSLGFVWLYSIPTYAANTFSPIESSSLLGKNLGSSPQIVSNLQDVLPHLEKANVVYLGETHDNPQDHQMQLDIIQSLHKRQPKVAIALEMFQRPYQQFLDQYIAEKITEQELLEKTEYKQRWDFPWEYYAPILRYARVNKLPVLALNTPSEITRQVAREGLASLTRQQRQLIPPLTEIRTDNVEYRQLILSAFEQHQQAGHGYGTDIENFFLAQVLWDETMAEKIAQFHQANPRYQVIVLAGQGHIIYGYGIPSRVARRLPKNIIQSSILLSPPEGEVNNIKTIRPIANFIINSPK
ncbi:ChaN family lipoprotein [Gloeocapsopsis dulcis]|uniref:Haem-binding uptake Tiki superfamily ChaN domain-containing protein n=1 Tax=Gloeocapsopsis dulcis AAB1 = 1H9 TaxID=1433147 RepID=A0A6N8G0F0_9CHRO|nr:ChaN family lipoprotein [Gloeocapsopsis dulcis]MUL38860.1 hypothetical protein [Gloeocapsopsis dulcis AAB1 = 1H9]WNN89289.1 ChaN family lipoprotein [Gloeocapsopsis dulcis]